MRGLEPKHYFLLATFLTGLATQISGLQHGWHDAGSPAFVAGFLMQIATLLGALYAGAPGATGQMTDRRQADSGTIADPSRLSDSTKLPVLPWILAASLLAGSAIVLMGCAGVNKMPTTITTPPGQRAYTADQILDRLKEISNVVIADTGSQPGNIAPADAFTIIEWISGDAHGHPPTTGIAQLIVAAGQGQDWKQIALSGWQGRIKPLFQKYPNLLMYADVIDGLLQVTLQPPQPAGPAALLRPSPSELPPAVLLEVY